MLISFTLSPIFFALEINTIYLYFISLTPYIGDEAFCAAHLAYLSTVAYNEYLKDTELGLMLPYTGKIT